MATKKKSTPIGKNIRFSEKGYKVIKAFTDKKGYRMGSFCEIAVMEKIQKESSSNP